MKSRRNAFTLIEMLVVIAIIAILMALIFPAVNKARKLATRTRAQVAVKDIRTAFLGYFDEYKRWPTGLTGYDNGTDIEVTATGIEMDTLVVSMLSGVNVNSQNPRQIPFLDIPPDYLDSQGGYVDPWGGKYKYMCDFNLDDRTHIFFTNNNGETNLPVTVAVWSRGRNNSDEADKQGDDVRSW